MYKAIDKDIATTDLTTIIHYAVKILNKYRNKESRGVRLEDLPDHPYGKILDICNQLLSEINIDEIVNQDAKIDLHINALYQILHDRLEVDVPANRHRGKVLLEQLRNS